MCACSRVSLHDYLVKVCVVVMTVAVVCVQACVNVLLGCVCVCAHVLRASSSRCSLLRGLKRVSELLILFDRQVSERRREGETAKGEKWRVGQGGEPRELSD